MESKSTIYTINEKRFEELASRVKSAPFSGQKDTLIKTATSIYAFTCKQVWKLIESYTGDSGKLEALEVLRYSIVDPDHHKKEIIEHFTFNDSKKKAEELFVHIQACKTEGEAPDKFPVIDLPYTSHVPHDTFKALLESIHKEKFSDGKVKAAKEAVLSKSEGLTPIQAEELLGCFTFSKDVLAVVELIHEKLMGFTCEQMVKLLGIYKFEDEKLAMLAAFKNSLTDIDNKFIILDVFTFSDGKEKARKILEDLKPKSFLFGVPQGKCVFVIDLSGSMSCTFKLNTGQSYSRLDFVKMELAKVLHTFDEKISFNIIPYSSKCTQWKSGMEKATHEAVDDALKYVGKFQANGGTNIYDALKNAFLTKGVETIYFLTDGVPSEGAKQKPADILNDVKKWHGETKAKINSIAFLMGDFSGDNKKMSREFMKELAEVTGGTYRSIESSK